MKHEEGAYANYASQPCVNLTASMGEKPTDTTELNKALRIRSNTIRHTESTTNLRMSTIYAFRLQTCT